MAVYSMESTQENCYPGTAVLINKFGLKEQNKLDIVERQIVLLKGAEIERNAVFKNVDFNYYKGIHRQLFEDIYDWAGKVRTINISKKGTVFFKYDKIEKIGQLKFKRLIGLSYLNNMDEISFFNELTELYNELNMLHPFREGNGRTLRLFITLLVRNTGRDISFADCDNDLLMIATIKAAQGDLSLLKSIFESIVKTI